ncbi:MULTISPECIES: hypothetical protein [Phyllobacteriaceae]|jgi:hypothetical protein|uniref:hypothetical protein n=1 Tax=Phyllobacteriaceae TaxID=69277 RepID=UPI0004663FD2|nr:MULTISPECIES: hypothetical protein [Mesorhizobium]MBN9234557.1 hypothetical protein [Mesorhizobium sp.]MDQ0328965.1 hypothetical protein [Mesorhizobium sp. YL-MeA3-2017]
MVLVNTVSTTATAALKLMSVTTAGSPAPVGRIASGLNPVSTRSLSPTVSDALLKIQQLVSGSAQESGNLAKAIVSAEKAKWLQSLGADSWVVKDQPQLGDAELREQVMANAAQNGTARLAGFSEALANGTLKIQRASEIPELGYRTVQVDLYSGGNKIGGAGYSEFNKDYWLAQRQAGTFLGLGSINGTDYVMSWAMPWEADNASLGTGIYAKS